MTSNMNKFDSVYRKILLEQTQEVEYDPDYESVAKKKLEEAKKMSIKELEEEIHTLEDFNKTFMAMYNDAPVRYRKGLLMDKSKNKIITMINALKSILNEKKNAEKKLERKLKGGK